MYWSKSMAISSADATALIEDADDRGMTLMVGHTFLFNPAVRWIKRYLHDGSIGRLYHLYFHRPGLGPIRHDVNTLWVFAPHDLSMLRYWLGQVPNAVKDRGESYLKPGVEDVVLLTHNCPERVMASVHVNWLDPVKTRRVTIVGERRMIVFDDAHPTEKLRVYNKGASYQPNRAEGHRHSAYNQSGSFLPARGRMTAVSRSCG